MKLRTNRHLLVALFAVAAWGQAQKAEIYVPILNATADPVSVTIAVLHGDSAAEQTFLAALAQAPQKATFICDNLANQTFPKFRETGSRLDWTTTGTNWPYAATVVACGTVTIPEHVNYQDVANQYTFGAWTSVVEQPNLKLQGRMAGIAFTDYCPPDRMGAGCEVSLAHPKPPVPTGEATISGTIAITMDGDNLNSWGVQGITLAFVPADDRSSYAQSIRASAGRASSLCSAISNASPDAMIATADADGRGGLDHKAGQEEDLPFRMRVSEVTPATHGTLFACTDSDIFAMMTQGQFPDTSLYRAKGHGLRWSNYTLALHPGDSARADLHATIDTSSW